MSDQKTLDERLALPVLELIELAQKEVSALNHGKRWRMSIPVDVDDSDVVISGALLAARKALVGVAQDEAALASFDAELDLLLWHEHYVNKNRNSKAARVLVANRDESRRRLIELFKAGAWVAASPAGEKP